MRSGLESVAAGVLLAIGLSCVDSMAPEVTARPEPPVPDSEASRWVSIYDPAKAANGYTLAFLARQIPVIIDMNGRIVHSWPDLRVKSRIRLLEDCSLLTISRGRAVLEYDWDGRLVWTGKLDGRRLAPHHDVIRLENGNTLMLALDRERPADELIEFDRRGNVVWQWYAGDHLERWLDRRPGARRKDLTHINSVQELPANPWFDAGDERFRPGNLLLSARNLSRLFVIDRGTGEAVWTYSGELDYQHEALMLGPEHSHNGRIIVFNNGYRDHQRRRSSVLEIEPVSGAITWRYESPTFFSPTGGLEQPLANGNMLVASSRGGRVFEITRRGEIVWQWTPPFRPNRPQRYAYDDCSRLAALDPPAEKPVVAPPGYRHIDYPVYRFAMDQDRRSITVDGSRRNALKENSVCRDLLLPEEATLEIGFGLDRAALEAAGRADYSAEFAATAVGADDSGEADELFRETARLSSNADGVRVVDLDAYGGRSTRLCLEVRALGRYRDEPTEAFAFWSIPAIQSAEDPRRDDDEDGVPEDLTAEEREVQLEHLRALGYVD